MKIIIDREALVEAVEILRLDAELHSTKIIKVERLLSNILKDHPWKSDGITGQEVNEWPEYAAEDYENINRKMIVHILYMLSAIHYEIDYKEMRAMAQKLLLKLAGQPQNENIS